MKTADEIKTALEAGQIVIETLTDRQIDWHLKFGARHYYQNGGCGAYDWPFVESARNVDYLADHLYTRQHFFGEVKFS